MNGNTVASIAMPPVRPDAAADCEPRDSAVHGATIDVEPAESAGERACDGAFPAGGGAVYGDDFWHGVIVMRDVWGVERKT